jgi:hypothetical protein
MIWIAILNPWYGSPTSTDDMDRQSVNKAKIKNMSGSGNPTDPIFLPPTLNFFFDFRYENFRVRKLQMWKFCFTMPVEIADE